MDKRQKILIVDDAEFNRVILKEILGETYNYLEAENGNQAIQIVEENPEIDLMLLDINMQQMNGFGVLEWMNHFQWIDETPVIMISSEESVDTMRKAYENLRSLKQNRYFKTWMLRILINKCKDILKQKKQVTYTDQMPETPFYEEEYAAKEWAQMLEPLDNKYRLVILLYYMEGFNIREISDILDMKESTVKSRLQRGRKQVAELYEYKVREGRA